MPSAPELVIPKRSVITVTEPEIPVAEPVAAKREAKKITLPSAATAPQPEPETTPAPTASAATKTSSEPVTPRQTEKTTASPQEPVQTAEPSVESESPKDAETADDKPPKTDADVRTALEEAKRQQEIQSYIENREFFVPINAVARKRSLKVSLALTFVELLLGLLLLNLMLDAGLIQLLEKIPHTNFFNLN